MTAPLRPGDPAPPFTLPAVNREGRVSLDDYREVIASSQVHVAERDGRIVGVIVLKITDEGFFIDNIAVRPAVKGAGVGRLLLGLRLRGQVLRQRQRERLAHRHRRRTPVDDQAVQHRVERRGRDRVGGRGSLVHRAHHPARPVDADEPDVGEAVRQRRQGFRRRGLLRFALRTSSSPAENTVVEARFNDKRPGVVLVRS